MNYPFEVKMFMVNGSEAAGTMAMRLIDSSKWFVVTPYPDDQYEFTVKAE